MSPVNFNMLLKRGGNEALDINSNYGTKIHLVTNGSDWYWTVFSIMSCAALAYIVAAFFVPRKERFFHYTSIAAAMFSALAYFSMASNLGWTGVETEFSHYQDLGIRQVFYARYIGWFLASPLLIVNMAFLAGLSWPTVLFMAGMQEIYVIAGLIGALVPSDYKWGYFTYGVAAFILVLYNLVYVAIQSIQTLQSASVYEKLTTQFRFVVGSVGLVYLLYPISWGLSEGGNVISPTSEGVFYGVLDIMALPLINSAVLYLTRQVDFNELGL
ncbi:hypothetical protein V1520DRAFT_40856 [Lipomyces starkeyi]|uniref:Rhodopsin n=1 Tax=Lipomyces starkeyi NRRL Y-11557 TaxID=675824 RepID=A0A1E3QF69_LIPST|nr:hypothetical protein LIPSTDRAFT_67101 [Lipomyces starkeyi NRRL Y-11557]